MHMGRIEGQFGGVYRRCGCADLGISEARCPHPWYYRVRHGTREIRKKVGPGPKGKKTAWQRLQQIQVNLVRENTLGIRKIVRATLEQFRPRVEAEMKPRLTSSSWEAFSSRYSVAAAFFTEPMDGIDEPRVREFLRHLGQRRQRRRDKAYRTVSAATRNRYLDCLSVVLNLAVSEGCALENPVPAIPREREAKERPPNVSRGDLDAILARCAPDLRPVANLIYETGLRRNEALHLDWREVDLPARMLYVGKAKTDRGVRPVALNGVAYLVLRDLQEARVAPLTGADPVFPALTDPKEVTRAFGRAARAANLPRVTLHKLRGSVATRLLAQGVGVSVVRDILGHSTVGVTDRYTSASPSRAMHDAMESLSGREEARKERTA